MATVAWNDVQPYLTRERRSHEQGELQAEHIAEFVRQVLDCEQVQVQPRGTGAPGWENGSCTRFRIYFDKNWAPLSVDPLAEAHRFRLDLAVSDRGPFIIGTGSEWLVSPADWAGGMAKLQPQESVEAEAKAKTLALAVASQFDLTYLEADWLLGFKLNAKELPEDVLMSLDYSDPDALNVLFDEGY